MGERAWRSESLSGAVNAVSPGAVTNAGFPWALARAMRRPAFLSVPTLAVRLACGQMGRGALVASARARPVPLLESGFEFRFRELHSAFRHVLH
jgi:NAD dependent epimerase/dehydratase family enzyme